MPIHHHHLVSEVDCNILNCDKDILNVRVPLLIQFTLDMDRELLVRFTAVRHKVVFTDTRKLVEISVKSFEVVVPPSTADIVAMARSSS